MIPNTTDRVVQNTSTIINEAIQAQTRENVARYAAATPALLDQRLRELDHEWDIERTTALGAAVGLLIGLALAASLDRLWLLLPAGIAGLLLLHALFGWSLVLPLLRRLGYRTATEIDHERYALKALRGDFRPLATVVTPQDREDLSRFEGEGGPPAPLPDHDAGHEAVVNEALRAVQS
jgi:hypothetical protein